MREEKETLTLIPVVAANFIAPVTVKIVDCKNTQALFAANEDLL